MTFKPCILNLKTSMALWISLLDVCILSNKLSFNLDYQIWKHHINGIMQNPIEYACIHICLKENNYGLAQNHSNFTAHALKLPQSLGKPSICCKFLIHTALVLHWQPSSFTIVASTINGLEIHGRRTLQIIKNNPTAVVNINWCCDGYIFITFLKIA